MDFEFVGAVLVTPEQLGVEELAGGLSHMSVRGVYQLIHILTVLVGQNLLIEPKTNTCMRC